VWKSQGRKYCEFCDCWFADNKVSISFHENGKRHKESVEKKVKEIQKKGSEREKKEKDEKKFLEMMEKGAAEAIEKDIKQDPRMINHYFGDDVEVPLPERSDDPPLQGPSLPPASKKQKKSHAGETVDSSASSSGVPPVKIEPSKVWHEALSPEGYSYYWNVETGQSVWVAPPGGYVPLSEQTEEAAGAASSGVKTEIKTEIKTEVKTEIKPEVKEEKKVGAGLVQRKSWKERAYGGDWSSVQKAEVKPVDLQLPQATVEANLEHERLAAAAAAADSKDKIEFKTKIVPSLTSSSTSAAKTSAIVFKKRKINPGANSRNAHDGASS